RTGRRAGAFTLGDDEYSTDHDGNCSRQSAARDCPHPEGPLSPGHVELLHPLIIAKALTQLTHSLGSDRAYTLTSPVHPDRQMLRRWLDIHREIRRKDDT